MRTRFGLSSSRLTSVAIIVTTTLWIVWFFGSSVTRLFAEDRGNEEAASSPCADWKTPAFALFVTGRQHGYIEPCGCTGLDQAKGGMSRRHTLLEGFKSRGWNMVCVDVGNQVRRVGAQADIKFLTTADMLRLMDYSAVGFGPDDLQLSTIELMSAIDPEMTGTTPFLCANASIAELHPKYRVLDVNGVKVGITSVVGKGVPGSIDNEYITCEPIAETLPGVVDELQKEKCDRLVLLAHCDAEETAELAKSYPMFDVIVAASSAGEPTLEPQRVTGSKTQIVQAGTKGIYVGVIGFYGDEAEPTKYERITLDSRLADSPKILERFATYQKQLRDVGMKGLGLRPVRHPRSEKKDPRSFVGHETCGECHTTAYAIFEDTPHFHATDSISKPTERSEIQRHFDPECLSCHVTGWNSGGYFPYDSGYLSLEESVALHSNGCENCHGPGSAHVAAENGDIEASDERIEQLRAEMRLTLEEAKKSKCYDCHDQDNSPDFDFDTYWPEVEHKGMD